jgi:hypothetical protein
MTELKPIKIFITAERRRPIVMTYLALCLSPITPKKHFPTPYNIEAAPITVPISDFVMLRSLQIAGIAIEKFCRIK